MPRFEWVGSLMSRDFEPYRPRRSAAGRAIMLLERFIVPMKQRDDVWFATLSDICDCGSDN